MDGCENNALLHLAEIGAAVFDIFSVSAEVIVGTLKDGYIRNVPLPRVSPKTV
jgi:hypothetical protein